MKLVLLCLLFSNLFSWFGLEVVMNFIHGLHDVKPLVMPLVSNIWSGDGNWRKCSCLATISSTQWWSLRSLQSLLRHHTGSSLEKWSGSRIICHLAVVVWFLLLICWCCGRWNLAAQLRWSSVDHLPGLLINLSWSSPDVDHFTQLFIINTRLLLHRRLHLDLRLLQTWWRSFFSHCIVPADSTSSAPSLLLSVSQWFDARHSAVKVLTFNPCNSPWSFTKYWFYEENVENVEISPLSNPNFNWWFNEV